MIRIIDKDRKIFDEVITPSLPSGSYLYEDKSLYLNNDGIEVLLMRVYMSDDSWKADGEGKDKGYSKIGVSAWNKGQKYIKDLKDKMIEKVINGEDSTNLALELKEIETKNLGNDYRWLEQFLTDGQRRELEAKSLPLDFGE